MEFSVPVEVMYRVKTVLKKSSSKSNYSEISVPVGVMYLGENCSSKLDFIVELSEVFSSS